MKTMEYIANVLTPNALVNKTIETPSLFHENIELDIDFSEIPVLRTDIGKWLRNSSDLKKGSQESLSTETPEEVSLLATIQENSQLPNNKQQRYQELWFKCEYETLSETELAEYQTLLSELDTRNIKRFRAIIALAKLREKSVDDIIAEIELKEEKSVV